MKALIVPHRSLRCGRDGNWSPVQFHIVVGKLGDFDRLVGGQIAKYLCRSAGRPMDFKLGNFVCSGQANCLLQRVGAETASGSDVPVISAKRRPATFLNMRLGSRNSRLGSPVPRYMSRKPSLSKSPKLLPMVTSTTSSPASFALSSKPRPCRL